MIFMDKDRSERMLQIGSFYFFPGNLLIIRIFDCFSIRYFIGLFDFIWELEPRVGDFIAVFNETALQVYCDWS